MTTQDVVLIFVTVTGEREGRLHAGDLFAKKIYAQEVDGRLLSAIQITTAAGICAMVDLLVRGQASAGAASCARSRPRSRSSSPTVSARHYA